jgi:hypothetical protein
MPRRQRLPKNFRKEPNTETQEQFKSKKIEIGADLIRFHFKDKLSVKQVLSRIIMAFAILSLFAVSGLTTPERIPMPDCRFKMLTGYSCPSCGMTHSFHAFAIGRFGTAFRYNWMGPLLFVMLMLLLLKLSVEVLTKKRTGFECPKILLRIACLLITALWLTFWAVRFSHECAHGRAFSLESPKTRLTCKSFAMDAPKTPR